MRSLRLMLPGLFLATLFFTASAFAQDVSFNFDKTADLQSSKPIIGKSIHSRRMSTS